MTTALITGVTGQDGSYLAEQLLDQGLRVVGVHRRLSAPNHWRIQHLSGRLELRTADLADSSCWLDLLEDVQPDELYNLGAQSFVPTSWEQPVWTAQATALGLVRLLEAVRRVSPQTRVYQASSSEMFGKPVATPQTEDTPFRPCSPYAVAKLYAHHMARNYGDAYGLHVRAGVLFNHESSRRGERFVTRKVAQAAARIKRGLQGELLIGDTTVARDWGFAGDYTRAMQAILRRGTRFEYVVATGVAHTVAELLEEAFSAVGLDWKDHTRADPRLLRVNEIPGLRGDAGRARAELGWAPSMDFSTLIRDMVQAEMVRCGSS